MDVSLKTTPFFEYHRAHDVKLAPFAGWNMPLHYAEGPKAEHLWVRKKAGLFDISHMARILLGGKEVKSFLSLVTTIDMDGLQPMSGAYGLILHPKGGVLDDIYLYNLTEGNESRYLMVANASNHRKVSHWIALVAGFDLKKGEDKLWQAFSDLRATDAFSALPSDLITDALQIHDQTEKWAMIALQGPQSIQLWKNLGYESFLPSDKNTLVHRNMDDFAKALLISRTGYTGEDGIEIIGSIPEVQDLWTKILEKKDEQGNEWCKPIGLAARDSLRFEPGYSLYGHEIEEDILPTEALLKWTLRKTDDNTPGSYIGAKGLIQGAEKSNRILRSIRMEEKAVPRQDYLVKDEDGSTIGKVLSGMFAPSLDGFFANILIDREKSQMGNVQYIEIRGKLKKSIIVKRPLYRA